jgi:hypothetical protein
VINLKGERTNPPTDALIRSHSCHVANYILATGSRIVQLTIVLTHPGVLCSLPKAGRYCTKI